MMEKFLRPLAIAAAASMAAALSGCVTTNTTSSEKTPQEIWPERFNDGTYGFMMTAVPRVRSAKPLPSISTLDVLRDEGVWLFNDREESYFKAGQPDANGDLKVSETYPKGQKAHGFAWGANVTAVIRDGKPITSDIALKVKSGPDKSVYVYSGPTDKPFVMQVRLYAFDVSGEYVYRFLRNHSNYPTGAAYYSTGRFPKGSVVYMPQITLEQDAFVVLNSKLFTGQNNIENFSKKFSGEIPYCLSYLPRAGYKRYGVSFADSGLPGVMKRVEKFETVKKTRVVTNKRGKKVKQNYTEKILTGVETNMALSGPAALLPVRTDTNFCQKTSDTPAAKGTYEIKTVDGTRGMALNFSGRVSSPDIGIFELSRGTVSPAIVEMHRGKGLAAVPGYYVKASEPITDFQYRFNKVAADAVRAELKKHPSKKAAKK